MELIQLPNGHTELIIDNDDLISLIKIHIGFEAGKMVEQIIKESEREYIRAESDLSAYELELEANRETFLELREMIGKIEDDLSVSRINRKNIQALLDRMDIEIANAL
ncbi:hypothetical protein F4V43_01920 [Paenibacillus spiritus]|uniref:Uncharacterized protein n=1 Tax=Paenibacillus spiritus TaxID=2496557 RepID=A0A5J5GGP8_9BACL|nr:hypothetical protein [Paenibacillus spiritus]KAA9007267.1 hypothetical protein F4V43_01920 [Paenibacillus spiritus]